MKRYLPVAIIVIVVVVAFSLWQIANDDRVIFPLQALTLIALTLVAASCLGLIVKIQDSLSISPSEKHSGFFDRRQLLWVRKFGEMARATEWTKFVELLLLSTATAGALFGLQVYKENNGLSMLLDLQARDRELRGQYLSAGASPDDWSGRNLIAVFADAPFGELDEDEADAAFASCNAQTQQRIHAWAVSYVNRAARVNLEWATLEDLYDQLWNSEAMLNRDLDLPRMMEMHASDYLYIVHDAFDARRKRYFTESEYLAWSAYLGDLGTSPFFLLALMDGEKYGYMAGPFAQEVRDQFLANKKMRCVAQTLYKDILTLEESQLSADAAHSLRARQ